MRQNEKKICCDQLFFMKCYTCLCWPSDEDSHCRRLKVYLSQKTDQCWLASWPFSGHEHAPGCRFYSIWSDERQAAIYAPDVVKAAPDGNIVVRLPTGLQKKDIQEKNGGSPGQRRTR